MDVLMSALGNLLALGTLSMWVRRPLLLLVALVAWLIPIASIITPATLSIGTHTAPSERRLTETSICFAALLRHEWEAWQVSPKTREHM
ncbi:hypothetical protein BST61_g11069 [Cercospora zeina]